MLKKEKKMQHGAWQTLSERCVSARCPPQALSSLDTPGPLQRARTGQIPRRGGRSGLGRVGVEKVCCPLDRGAAPSTPLLQVEVDVEQTR